MKIESLDVFMRFRRRLAAALAIALLALPSFVADAAGAAMLASHRAVYEIELLASRDGAGPTAARGLMAYEFTDGCERWIVDNRIVLDVVYGEETPVRIDWTFTSWETKDGREYGYNLVHKRNNNLQEELKGTAKMNDGGNGRAEFTGDPAAVLILPEGTLFPTAHLLASFKAALSGEKTFFRPMFDGASLDNPYNANILFLKPKSRKAEARRLMAEAGLPADAAVWRFNAAFFSNKQSEGTPAFELEVDYREDGVAERIVQEFSDFSLLMTPKKLDRTDGGC